MLPVPFVQPLAAPLIKNTTLPIFMFEVLTLAFPYPNQYHTKKQRKKTPVGVVAVYILPLHGVTPHTRTQTEMDTLDTSASEESEVAPTPAPGGFDMPQPQAQAAQPDTIMIPTSEESEVAPGAFGAAPTPALGGFDMPQPQAQAAQPGTGNPPRSMAIQPQDEDNSKALSSNSLKSADGLRRVEDDTKGNKGGTAGIIAAQQPGGFGNPVSPFGATPAAGGFGAAPMQASGGVFSFDAAAPGDFGDQAPPAAAPGFGGLGASPAAAATPGGFNYGSSPAGGAFGAAPVALGGAFSFGAAAASAAAVPAPGGFGAMVRSLFYLSRTRSLYSSHTLTTLAMIENKTKQKATQKAKQTLQKQNQPRGSSAWLRHCAGASPWRVLLRRDGGASWFRCRCAPR